MTDIKGDKLDIKITGYSTPPNNHMSTRKSRALLKLCNMSYVFISAHSLGINMDWSLTHAYCIVTDILLETICYLLGALSVVRLILINAYSSSF